MVSRINNFRNISPLLLLAFLFTGFNCAGLYHRYRPDDYPEELIELEREILKYVNRYRESHHLRKLDLNDSITFYARRHSSAMARKDAPFNHDYFERRVYKISLTVPLQAAGENLAYHTGFGDFAKSTFEAWLKSPAHRQNIGGKFDLTGIGVVKTENESYYFTQIFVQQR